MGISNRYPPVSRPAFPHLSWDRVYLTSCSVCGHSMLNHKTWPGRQQKCVVIDCGCILVEQIPLPLEAE